VSVLVVGEALVDVLVAADGTQVERVGGSPANVAVGLGRLGHRVTLLTALGDDERARAVRDHLQGSRVGLLAAPLARTAVARAALDQGGVATYEFEIAWDLGDLVPPTADWLHLGSLGAALEPGASRVRALVEEHPGVVSYDPNVRALLMDDPDVLLELAARTDVVKLSEEDAAWLRPGVSPAHVAQELLGGRPSLVVVTLGGDGAIAVLHGMDAVVHVPAAQGAPVVDTVGAGDAFMAGLVDALVDLDLAHLDAAAVTTALRHAAVVARRTCERVGADPPWREDLP
jgi:fructokinase